MTGLRQFSIAIMVIFTIIVGFAAETLAADTIRIGDINSYKRLPAFTVPYKQGLMLAIEQINAKGGVLGKKIEIISRDDQGKPGVAVKLADELVKREKVIAISGTLFSHIGLALTSYAGRQKVLYLAAEPLADAITWAKGNRYTFRLRPSTYMQADMLAQEAAKLKLKRWATIAPNYAYGKSAVAAFQKALKARQPGVEFVGAQWPALFKIKAGAEVQALAAAKPQGIFNVTFGPDLAKFVREGKIRGLFDKVKTVGLLTGEPEYLDPLKSEAPVGWIVTGYPWYDIKEAAHKTFVAAYRKRWKDYPRVGSIVGYNTGLTLIAALKKAGSTKTEALIKALRGLNIATPIGTIHMRALDHQSTMGAYVGKIGLKGGKGVMVDWYYADGAKHIPSDAEVRKLRPAAQ